MSGLDKMHSFIVASFICLSIASVSGQHIKNCSNVAVSSCVSGPMYPVDPVYRQEICETIERADRCLDRVIQRCDGSSDEASFDDAAQSLLDGYKHMIKGLKAGCDIGTSWTAWSSCISGRRDRIRECSTYKSVCTATEQVCADQLSQVKQCNHVECHKCARGWHLSPVDKRCYKYFGKALAYKDAINACHKLGGDMAAPRTENLTNFILDLRNQSERNISIHNLWIPMKNVTRGGNWRWVWEDGDDVASHWTSWKYDPFRCYGWHMIPTVCEPVIGECAYISSINEARSRYVYDKGWRPTDCQGARPYMCSTTRCGRDSGPVVG